MLSRRVSALLTRSYKGTLPSIRMAHSTKVAVCQMTSTNNKSSNIDTATSLIKEAASKGAKVGSLCYYKLHYEHSTFMYM